MHSRETFLLAGNWTKYTDIYLNDQGKYILKYYCFFSSFTSALPGL